MTTIPGLIATVDDEVRRYDEWEGVIKIAAIVHFLGLSTGAFSIPYTVVIPECFCPRSDSIQFNAFQ